MVPSLARNDILKQLQKEILCLQGFRTAMSSQRLNTGLAFMENAFPDQAFPIGAIHEFISPAQEDAAATSGFIAGLLSSLMKSKGACVWISTKRTLFPPALTVFGIAPERIIFIDTKKQKDTLWAIEEALKCKALSAVVGELSELSFTESRRLQLAVEESSVTGFIHRYQPKAENTVACITRWKIKQLASVTDEGMPGVSFPRWDVRLLKVRNGRPGAWQVEWAAGRFKHIPANTPSASVTVIQKTG